MSAINVRPDHRRRQGKVCEVKVHPGLEYQARLLLYMEGRFTESGGDETECDEKLHGSRGYNTHR